MGFKANQAEAEQGNNIKPEGDYECIIVKCEERTTKNGATGLNFTYVIRNDVEQKFKNGYIFDTLWKRKEPTQADMSVNGYGFGQIMAMGKATKLPDGKDYENLEAFIADLMNKPIRITIKHEEYKGNMQERVSYKNATKYPDVKHIMKTKTNTAQTTYAAQPAASFAPIQAQQLELNDLSDEDLPF